ncbi:MAG: J domain-containing protein [Acidimicrobiales bacterium]
MDRDEAAALLGVEPSSQPAAVRAAWRSRIRTRHPDRAGPQATDEAARLNEAYALLRRGQPTAAPPATPAPASSARSGPRAARGAGAR